MFWIWRLIVSDWPSLRAHVPLKSSTHHDRDVFRFLTCSWGSCCTGGSHGPQITWIWNQHNPNPRAPWDPGPKYHTFELPENYRQQCHRSVLLQLGYLCSSEQSLLSKWTGKSKRMLSTPGVSHGTKKKSSKIFSHHKNQIMDLYCKNLGPGSQEALGLRSCWFQNLVIWGPSSSTTGTSGTSRKSENVSVMMWAPSFLAS